MHIEQPKRRVKPISMTPLVDIIFLLLLFFMLSSTFSKFSEVGIGAPGGAGGAAATPGALLLVRDGALLLNGTPIEDTQTLVEQARRLLDEGKTETVLVLARGATSTQDLVEALTALRSVSGLSVTVAR